MVNTAQEKNFVKSSLVMVPSCALSDRHPTLYVPGKDGIISLKFKYKDSLSTSYRAEYITLSFSVLDYDKSGIEGQLIYSDIVEKIAKVIARIQRDTVVWDFVIVNMALQITTDSPCSIHYPLNTIRGSVNHVPKSISRMPLKIRMYGTVEQDLPQMFQHSIFGCSEYASPIGSKYSDPKIKELIDLFSKPIDMPMTGMKMKYVKRRKDGVYCPIDSAIAL